ncbi:hypothetical protein Tco_0286019 [Tanacetum coccineum]
MVSFRQFHSHLKLLSNNDLKGTRTESGFKRAFATLFGQDVETFTSTMFLNMDQLEKQLDNEEFQEIRSMAAFKMQTTKEKVDTSKALNARLVDTESSRTESKEQDTSSISGNDAHADIKPIYDEKLMAEEKEFAIAALKNELRKLTVNSVNTKFAKSSILGKPVLQPHRNQSVVRQPTTFKSERPRISKPRFASQIDVNNDLSQRVTTHYLPKERESAVVKPHYAITSSESRNSSKNMPRFSSNNMVHNHYLKEAKKKTQERGRNSRPSMMPSARSQSTANDCKPKPRINDQKSRNWPASKSSYVTTKTVPIAEHSRNSRKFFDTKHFVCLTCQKCVFNANHDTYVKKFLNEVNSHVKVSSHKITNRNKPEMQISVPKKLGRQIPTGHRYIFQSQKGRTQSMVAEKTDISETRASSRQDIYITTRVGITIPPSHNNAEVNV